MFFFSSFLAGVPVLIMAFFYMLYFGAYALNKPKVDENDFMPVVEELVVEADSAIIEESSFNYHQSEIFIPDFLPALSDEPISFRILRISPLIAGDRIDLSSYFAFDLFSRPPPSIA